MSRRTVAALSTSVVLGAAAVFGAGAATAGPPTPAGGSAQVSSAAAAGGHVIVILKDQYGSLKANQAQGARRRAATRSSQAGVAGQIKASGGAVTLQLVSVNALAATVSRSEVAALRRNPGVASIQRDLPLAEPQPAAVPGSALNSKVCPSNPNKPLLEPEALSVTHFASQPARSDDADTIATGQGVRVGLTGINGLAGNPNLIRPNGDHVVIDSPTPNADDSNYNGGGDEWYGDASAVAGQATVTYDMSKELPYSGLPAGCTFKIEGMSPDVQLVDTGYFGQGNPDTTPTTESQEIAGLDNAAIDDGVSVISESYGYGSILGQTDFSAIYQANDALVAAGITVVESAGDSGQGGTVEVPAYDPLVIDAGASTTFRLLAQAWGYSSWEDNQIAALSSGGTTPANNVVDLVAPGQAGEASCSPASATCPPATLTEAFGGTSQSAPFIAGAAADVIQAYRDSHGGTSPTPALVKQLLTSTATDIDAPADDQGSGLLNVDAAVRAAQNAPGSTVTSDSAALIASPTQLNVTGDGGTTSSQSVTLYNSADRAVRVTGTYRRFGAATPLRGDVTENITAPPASAPLPAEGAQAAAPVTVRVRPGTSQLNADFITPDPTNSAVLSLLLYDPKGRLSQVSYDYSSSDTGPVSNHGHVQIADPIPGTWTARIVWNNGRTHLQDPPPTPGSYRGPITVRFTGQQAITSRAAAPVTIQAHASATIPLSVTLPNQPGDAPESVQFSSQLGSTSVPVTRRTLIGASGTFSTTLGSAVSRGAGPLHSLQVQVPAGLHDLQITFRTADASANDLIDYSVVEPDGIDDYYDRTPSTTVQGIGSQHPSGQAAVNVADPAPGLWTVQAMIDLTTSGKEFNQTVRGQVSFNASRVTPYNVPDSTSTTLAAGSSIPLTISVKNTSGVGRTYTLSSPNKDVTSSGTYIPAGATALVTGTLTPAAASGTAVTGDLTVGVNYSDLSAPLVANGYFFDDQSVATVPYAYTVG